MQIMSTVNTKHHNEINDISNLLDKFTKDAKEYRIFFLNSIKLNRFQGDQFVNEICDRVENNKEITENIIIAEQPSHRMDGELNRVFKRMGSSVLGTCSKQRMHVFILSHKDYDLMLTTQDYNKWISHNSLLITKQGV